MTEAKETSMFTSITIRVVIIIMAVEIYMPVIMMINGRAD
jgi:hypothetical protein